MSDDQDWMLVEFEGSYMIAHPDGIKGQKVLRNFHVRVEMAKDFLFNLKPFESLRAPFSTYYMEQLKQMFPKMISLYQFRMVEATELDGSKIADPRAMCHADLLEYIKVRKYPINSSFYNDQDLRHEVHLYENDKKGQQHLQANLEKIRGGVLAVSKRIRERGMSVMQILDDSEEGLAHKEVHQKAVDSKIVPKSGKEAAKLAPEVNAALAAADDLVANYTGASAG